MPMLPVLPVPPVTMHTNTAFHFTIVVNELLFQLFDERICIDIYSIVKGLEALMSDICPKVGYVKQFKVLARVVPRLLPLQWHLIASRSRG